MATYRDGTSDPELSKIIHNQLPSNTIVFRIDESGSVWSCESERHPSLPSLFYRLSPKIGSILPNLGWRMLCQERCTTLLLPFDKTS